jgi:hypothetical protein
MMATSFSGGMSTEFRDTAYLENGSATQAALEPPERGVGIAEHGVLTDAAPDKEEAGSRTLPAAEGCR